MKATDKKKPIPTIPEGVWESRRPVRNKHREENKAAAYTDLQGNGYPAGKHDRGCE